MGVYIPKMEMPKICEECPCFDEEFYYCNVKKENLSERLFDHTTDPPPNWCPLVEFPPHGDLIDRDSVLEILSDKNAAWDGYVKVKALPIVVESEE